MIEWITMVNGWRKMEAEHTFDFGFVVLNIIAPKNYIGWLFLSFELLLIIALVLAIKLLIVGGAS